MRNSPTIFRFEQREVEPSKFTANCVKIAQFATPNRESREICAILVNSTNPCFPTVPQHFSQQIPRNSLTSLRPKAIDAKLTNSSTSYILYFQTLLRQDPTPCLCELREFRNLKLKFANSS